MTAKADSDRVEDNGVRDRAVDYNREGQEREATGGGDSGVAMMVAEAKDGGGG